VFIYFEDDWITPTEIAVTQILGHLPNPLGRNKQITPLLSAIHSGLLFLISLLSSRLNAKGSANILSPAVLKVIVLWEINIS